MTTQSIRVILSANVANYIAGMNQAVGATKLLAGAGGLLVGATALGVKSFADFDQAMSYVRANAEGTPAEFAKLGESVRSVGKDFGYSAVESANGAEELAKAGLSLSEIMGGALTGSLTLAAAGGVSVAEASETAATAMSMFKLEGKDVGHIADVLAAGANASTASVGSLSQALRQGGGVAESFGVSLEDTVAALAMFDQNGLKGADAGTSLKTMLTALANPSKKAAEAMADLGIEAFDASGKFIGMAGLQDVLKTKMAGLTQEQRAQAMATIFGSDAMRAANVLFSDTKGMQQWRDSVDQNGAAAKNAGTRMDNLKGDLTKLKAAFMDVMIGQGSNGGFLRPVTQGATGALNAINALPDGVKSAGFALAAFGGAGLLAAAGVVKVANTVRATKEAWTAARASIAAWSTAAGGTGSIASGIAAKFRAMGTAIHGASLKVKAGALLAVAAIAAMGVAAATSGDQVENFGRTSATLGSDLLKLSKGGMDTSAIFKDLQLALVSDKSFTLVDGFKELNKTGAEANATIAKMTTSILGIVGAGGTGAAGPVAALKGRLKGVGDELGRLVDSGQGATAARAFDQIAVAAAKGGTSVDELKKLMPGYTDALQRAAQEAEKAKSPTQQAADAINKVGSNANAAKEDVKALTDALKGLGSAQLDERGSAREFQSAIDDASGALKENGRNLDITTEKGRKNQAALDNIAKATTGWAASVYTSTGSMEQANSVLESGRTSFINTATAMGMSADKAKYLADELFKLPDSVNIGLAIPGVENVITKLDDAGRRVYAIKGTNITIPVDSPGAETVITALANVRGARQNANGTVTIQASANTESTMAKLASVKGARVDANGNVTIDTHALNTPDTIAKLQAIANLVKNRAQYITTYYQTKQLGPGTAITPKPGMRMLPGAMPQADGGIRRGGVQYMADGGVMGSTSSTAAFIAKRGSYVVMAEDETDGEAYIPFAASKRPRSRRIAAETVRRLGGSVTWRASGGVTGSSWSPDMSGILAIVQGFSYDNEKDAWDKLNTAKSNAAKVVRDLAAARKKLAEDQQRRVPASRLLADQNKVNDLLAKQVQLTNGLTAAQAKYNNIKSVRAVSVASQFNTAAGQRNALTKKFLDDTAKIARAGFPDLARSLLEQNDEDAVRLAASFASSGVAAMRKAQQQLSQSSKLAAQRDSQLARLNGTAPQAQLEQNAEWLARMAANQSQWGSPGVMATSIRSAPAPSDSRQIATAVRDAVGQLTANVTVVSQLDGNEVARAVTAHQFRVSSYGDTNPGLS